MNDSIELLAAINNTIIVANSSNLTENHGNNNNKMAFGYHIPMQIVVTLLIILFLVNFIGNVIVVLIIAKKRRMQTFTNWLLMNLAIADLSVAVICIPLEIPIEIKGYWIYGRVFCKIFFPIQTMSIYGSVFTLVVLSFSR